MIPYYLCWLVITGFYIYISPGLLDKRNNIPFYQVIMLAIYLLFACIYPIYLAIVISSEEKSDTKDDKNKTMFKPEDSLKVCLPLMILFGIHFLVVLP